MFSAKVALIRNSDMQLPPRLRNVKLASASFQKLICSLKVDSK